LAPANISAMRRGAFVIALWAACRSASSLPSTGSRTDPAPSEYVVDHAIDLADPAIVPADEAALLAARDRRDVAAMRAHAWEVFAAIQPAWMHWPSSDVVFGEPDRIFRPLQPFHVAGRVERETLPVMFAVVFDPIAAAHVRRHRLASRVGLRAAGVAIPPFPRAAITLKLVWYPVKHAGTTALPIWDNAPARADADGNPSRTWSRRVVIDPALASAAGDRVPLSAFLYRTLREPDELAAARSVAHDPTLAVGDHVVLVGMHVSTREIPEWVWATFWWHDQPDAGPYAADRPAALAGAARSYLMDVAYSAEAPAEPDGSPHACMNPWLEARFPNGLHSNCVACHQRAAFGATDYLPVTRGPIAAGDPYFANKVTTDLVWSLALEAK
jgi:hypothetical protein